MKCRNATETNVGILQYICYIYGIHIPVNDFNLIQSDLNIQNLDREKVLGGIDLGSEATQLVIILDKINLICCKLKG